MKSIPFITAIALVAIAGNLTYENIAAAKSRKAAAPRAEVVEVIGKYSTLFDGHAFSEGILVKTNHGLKVIPYDQGSMADNPDWKPKYLSVLWPTKIEDRPIIAPATVD